MENKACLTAAERKRKSRQNKMSKMTPEELQQYKAKENTRRSELRIKQREKMSPEDLSNYRKNDAMRKAEKKKEICEPEIVNIIYSPPYHRKQNYGKAMKNEKKVP